MRIEVEKATAELFHENNWKPKDGKRRDLLFSALFDYLPALHKRWKHIRDYTIKVRDQPCMRSLTGVFYKLISRPLRLQPLLNDLESGSTSSDNESSMDLVVKKENTLLQDASPAKIEQKEQSECSMINTADKKKKEDPPPK
jgi:hypothetical protein